MSDPVSLTDREERRAARLHEESIVIDGLSNVANYFEEPGFADHLERGGQTAGNYTVAGSHQPDLERCVERIERHHAIVETTDDLRLVTSAADVRAAKANDERGMILGTQDTRPIGTDLANLRALHRLGVRIVQLTYNFQNFVGSGCCEADDGGLSNFGRELVGELNELGMVIDCSHCGPRTTMEAIEVADDPVVFSHVGAYEVCNAEGRNKTDAEIRAVAETGGLTAIAFFPAFISRDPETYAVRPATVHDVVDHIEHVVDVAGIDHVGFGTDMNDVYLERGYTPPNSVYRSERLEFPEVYGRGPTEEYDPFPAGVDRHTKLPNLTRALVERGFDDDEIAKILGGNWLRVFDEVWGSVTHD